MKKILILGFTCIITFNLFGCSRAALEKNPIVIEDSSEANIDVSEPPLEPDNQTNVEKQEEYTGTASNLPETFGDLSSNDTDKTNSGSQGTNEAFKDTVMIEGMEEDVNYSTYQSEYGYQMNYDAARFTVTSENGIDTFMAENPNPDIYPYVFINITKSEYTKEKRDLRGIIYVYDEATNQTLFTDSPKDNVKIGAYDAVHFEVIDGNEWNSLVKHIYLITFEKNYYVIETNYFLEASEGYGTRIEAMLDTLIIDE